MEHQAEALKERTKQFALRIIRVIRSVPAGSESRIIGHQLLRSGMSGLRTIARFAAHVPGPSFWRSWQL